MEKVDRIAEKLAEDWRRRAPYAALSGPLRPDDMTEAYRAQAALQGRLADERGAIAGRKIALSSATMQAMCGIDHPVAGAIFARDVWEGAPDAPAQIRLDAFRHLGVEFELALTLARDVAPSDAPHDASSVRALIAGARPAFELIEDRAADYAALDVLTLVADNAWCGGVVLGPEIADWRSLDLGALQATLSVGGPDGVAVDETASTSASDPLGSLAFLLNLAAEHGRTVRAGEVAITGSTMRTRFVAAGTRLQFEIAGASAALDIV